MSYLQKRFVSLEEAERLEEQKSSANKRVSNYLLLIK
jgi:hypothetical protein